MSEWVLMPSTKSEPKEICEPVEYDDDEYKYRVYIPLPAEILKTLKVGTSLEIMLKGAVKRVSLTSDEKGGDSGEVCIRVKAAKLPSQKDAMESYANSLADED